MFSKLPGGVWKMTKLVIDAGCFDSLAGVRLLDGRIGLDVLLNGDSDIVITKAVREEILLAARFNAVEVEAWFTQNASRIEGLDFDAYVGDVGSGLHAGENSIRAYLSTNADAPEFQILTNDKGFYTGEINSGIPGQLRTPGQAAPPYRGVFDFLHAEAAAERLSPAELNHVGDAIYRRFDGANRLSPLFLDMWENPNAALPRTLAFNLNRILQSSSNSIVTATAAGFLYIALAREAEARGNGATVADIAMEYGLSISGQQLLDLAGETATDLAISTALGPVGWARKAYELWQSGEDVRGLVQMAHELYPTNQAIAALNVAVKGLEHLPAGDRAALFAMIDGLIGDDDQNRLLADLPYGEIIGTEQSAGGVLEIYQVDNPDGTFTKVFIDSESGEVARLESYDNQGRRTTTVDGQSSSWRATSFSPTSKVVSERIGVPGGSWATVTSRERSVDGSGEPIGPWQVDRRIVDATGAEVTFTNPTGPADNARLTVGGFNWSTVPWFGTTPIADPTGTVLWGFNTGDFFAGSTTINDDGLFVVAQNYLITGNTNPGRQEVQNKANDVTQRLDQGDDEYGAWVVAVEVDGQRFILLQAQAPEVLNIDPLVLDLNGDGIALTDWVSRTVLFDGLGDGRKHQMGWIAGGDGILVLDRNDNGSIDDITETVSVKLGGVTFADGIAALKSLAMTGADVFSRATSRTNAATGNLYFDDLRVWVDANADGRTDAGELKTLDALGIASIGLVGSGNSGEAIAGNDIVNRTTYTKADGSTGEVASVDFQADGAAVTTTELEGAIVVRAEGAETVTGYIVTDAASRTIEVSSFTLADGTHPDAFYSTTGDDSFLVDPTDTRAYWLGGGTGSLTLRGGAGDDLLFINASTLQANIDGGAGYDIVKVNDTQGVMLDLAAAHVEQVIGDDGNDVFNASGMTSSTFLDGQGGSDILIGGIANDAIGGGSGDDYIDGGRGNDILRGGDGNDVIAGGDGDDIIFGEGGNDILIGGAVSGPEGANMLEGGAGDDLLIGTGGYSVARYQGSFADYTVTRNADGTFTVADSQAGRDGTDTLQDIAALDFADISQVTLDASNPSFNDSLPANDRIEVSGSGPYVIATANIVANDKNYAGNAVQIRELLDVDGNTIARGQSGTVVGGTVALSSDGSTVTFTPTPGFTGIMAFKYHVVQGLTVGQIGTTNTAEMVGTVYLTTPDQPTDELLVEQWYLPEANVLPVWEDYTGAGVSIAVFDPSGNVDLTHPDLAANAGHTIKSNGKPGVEQYGMHATLVAGVIGAARNGQGVVGVAYCATISSVALPDFLYVNDTVLSLWKDYDVVNNSWVLTSAFADNFLANPGYESVYYSAVSEGRDGKGTILVFAAGNDRDLRNTNDLNETNSFYGITVAGINAKTDLASLTIAPEPFSTRGETILVSAPGSNIASTSQLLTSSTGTVFGSDYAVTQGTSFATPIVSGIVALMLEANPDLGYRDVQDILAYTARKVDDPAARWQVNSATNWNGGGLHYSTDYGFGEVDARAAVRLAETWQQQKTTDNLLTYNAWSQTMSVGTGPDAFVVSYVAPDPSIRIEHVTIIVDIDADLYPLGDLKIVFAPLQEVGETYEYDDDQQSVLLDHPQSLPEEASYVIGADGHRYLQFAFGSVKYRGQSMGDTPWVLRIFSDGEEITPSTNWGLLVTGSGLASPQQWIFTDEYAGGAALAASLGDSFNASAATGDNVIDLNSGTRSSINGFSVVVAGSFTSGLGGDGNDILYANSLSSSILSGGRGNDTLIGGAGSDRFLGGEGLDTVRYNGNYSDYGIEVVDGIVTITNSIGISDTLIAIEHIQFADFGISVENLNEIPTLHLSSQEDLRFIISMDMIRGALGIDALTEIAILNMAGIPFNLYSPEEGGIEFLPLANFNGAASFDFIGEDGFGEGRVLHIAIDVAPVNDAPTATDHSLSIDQDTAITIAASDLLNGADDVDGDTLSIVGISNISNGTAQLNLNGSVSFAPASGYSGVAAFDYTVSDGNGGFVTRQVKLNVAAGNAPAGATRLGWKNRIARTDDYWGYSLIYLSENDGHNGILSNGLVVQTASPSGSVRHQIYEQNGSWFSSVGGLDPSGWYFARSKPQATALANGGWTYVVSGFYGPGRETNSIIATIYGGWGEPVYINGRQKAIIVGDPESTYNQRSQTIAGLSGGGFVVSWIEEGDLGDLVKAQVFAATGTKIGNEILIKPEGDFVLYYDTSITAWDNGGFFVSWTDWSRSNVSGQLFDDQGQMVGEQLQLNTLTDYISSRVVITPLEFGNYVATWSALGPGGSGFDVWAQLFNAEGLKIGAEIRVNTDIRNDQMDPDVAALGGGGFVVTWTDGSPWEDGESGNDIKVQVFDALGGKIGGEFLAHSPNKWNQYSSSVYAKGGNVFMVSWLDATDYEEWPYNDASIIGMIVSTQYFVVDEIQLQTLPTNEDAVMGGELDNTLLSADGVVDGIYAADSSSASVLDSEVIQLAQAMSVFSGENCCFNSDATMQIRSDEGLQSTIAATWRQRAA